MGTNKQLQRTFQFLVPIVALLAVWELVSRSGAVNSKLFPPPSLVAQGFREWAVSGEMVRDLITSLWRAVLGFAVGGALGAMAGLATGRSQMLDRILSPIFHLLRPLPPVAIIPLVIVWFGVGNTGKLFSISFAVFFPVWINAHLGSRQVPQEYLWSAQLLRKSSLQILRSVILPGSLPSIFAGLRTALAIALIMVYVSEIAGASAGLGYQISVSHLAYRIDKMMAALAVLGLCGAGFDYLFTKVVQKSCPWFRFESER